MLLEGRGDVLRGVLDRRELGSRVVRGRVVSMCVRLLQRWFLGRAWWWGVRIGMHVYVSFVGAVTSDCNNLITVCSRSINSCMRAVCRLSRERVLALNRIMAVQSVELEQFRRTRDGMGCISFLT